MSDDGTSRQLSAPLFHPSSSAGVRPWRCVVGKRRIAGALRRGHPIGYGLLQAALLEGSRPTCLGLGPWAVLNYLKGYADDVWVDRVGRAKRNRDHYFDHRVHMVKRPRAAR